MSKNASGASDMKVYMKDHEDQRADFASEKVEFLKKLDLDTSKRSDSGVETEEAVGETGT